MEYMRFFFEKNGAPKIWLFWGRILAKIFEWIFLEGFFVGKYDFKIQNKSKLFLECLRHVICIYFFQR